MSFREPVLVFDIETIPDLDGGRRIMGLEQMNDAEVWAAMKTQRLAQKGNDFMPGHLQRVVAISVALRQGDSFKCWRSEEHTSELQSLMRISYAVFCLKKKNTNNHDKTHTIPKSLNIHHKQQQTQQPSNDIKLHYTHDIMNKKTQ